MKEKDELKLFISYSHFEESFINDFTKHLSPLKNNGFLKEWYDRKILAGENFKNTINNNLENADIICLCISANFLASTACMEELKISLELKKKNGIIVIPIILSACGWKDIKEISILLALPTDGKPISEFSDKNSGWNNVYEGLKNCIEQELKVKKLKITDSFQAFLNSTELLSKAHSNKTEVFLEEIFVYPDLIKYDDLKDYEKKIESKKLIDDFLDFPKILIAGEDQSGKTTLCKIMYFELRKKNYVPIIVSDKNNKFEGKIDNFIKKGFKEQYENIQLDEIDINRIVPIIDDFHFAKNKEKHIRDLSSYKYQIIIVDDIFNLNFRDENLTKSFYQFKIKQLSASLRNKLIENWINLTDNIGSEKNENDFYKELDKTTELVNTSLGKLISSGIMPAYPFFILSIISTYETFNKPLDQEITSQGYCYQALIYMYLSKQNVKNDEIDTYINFLSVFAFNIYSKKKREISQIEFNSFLKEYLKKYNLPVNEKTLVDNLVETKLLYLDSCNNYSFFYHYIYYFFVGLYFSDHLDECKRDIEIIINNLHKDENAYIAIFISHHSKDTFIIEEIILNSLLLFEKFQPAALTKEELNFFDEKLDSIVKVVLPSNNFTPARERVVRLKEQDALEKFQKNSPESDRNKKNSFNEAEVEIEIRRSIKTVEVMGRIIKNRAGSLEKEKLENIFEEAMHVNLRILTSFFEIIKNENRQIALVNYIESRLGRIIDKRTSKPNSNQLKRISKDIFWNLNLSVIYGIVNKTIHSLGSDKLIDIFLKVCDKNNTPATLLIKHGILMWYSKNLRIDEIADIFEENSFSETAKRIMRFMIVNHCSLHKIDYRKKQKIENKLKIPSKVLLT